MLSISSGQSACTTTDQDAEQYKDSNSNDSFSHQDCTNNEQNSISNLSASGTPSSDIGIDADGEGGDSPSTDNHDISGTQSHGDERMGDTYNNW